MLQAMMMKLIGICLLSVIIKGVGTATPLQVCQEHRNGILYELPSLMNCSEEQYQPWQVKLDKLNIKQYSTEARAVRVIQRKCVTEFSFFGAKSIIEQTSEAVVLDKKAAQILINQGSCIDQEGAITMDNGKDQFKCNYKWTQHTTTVVHDCYHYKGVVVATYNGQLRSDLTDMANCHYHNRYCVSSSGVHIEWDILQEVDRKYVEVGNFNGTKVGNRLLLPELGMSFDITHPAHEVGNEYYDREFRITLISQEEENLGRVQGTDEIQVLKDEINSKLSFLENMIKSPHFKAKMLCSNYNNLAKLEQAIASADATHYIRYKTNNQLQIARKLGEFVLAFPCLAVKSYSWNYNHSRCYQDVGVTYQLEGTDKVFQGYVDSRYNYVVTKSIEIDCHKQRAIYTDIDGQLVLHNGQGRPTALNVSRTEKLDYDLNRGIDFLDFLDVSWAYKEGELVHVDTDRQ